MTCPFGCKGWLWREPARCLRRLVGSFFCGSDALTPGRIEPRRGRTIKALGRDFRRFIAGVAPSLADEAKYVAGEDFRQLLAALDGGQVGRCVGRHGGTSWFPIRDATRRRLLGYVC